MYDVGAPGDGFDICHKGIAFAARDLIKERNPAFSLASYPYYIALDSFTIPPSQKPKPISVRPDDTAQVRSHVRFSPDASSIGFINLVLNDPYNMRLHMTSVNSLDAFDVLELVNNIVLEDHDPPQSFEFAGRSDAVILVSESCGRDVLSHLTLADAEKPRVLFKEGSLAGVYPLIEGDYNRMLISSSSFVDSSLWQVLSLPEAKVDKIISSATKDGAKFGLSRKQVTEIWYSGADDKCVQSWIFYPSNFDENKKYPWILTPHGGPVSVWKDAWNTRVRSDPIHC